MILPWGAWRLAHRRSTFSDGYGNRTFEREDVKAFVPSDQIDVRYYNGKTWYLLPDGSAGAKPYALLYKTMEEQGLFAFAEVFASIDHMDLTAV